jgi:hypothetical protein
MNTTTTQPEVIATRKTFDGVTIFLHADGQVSNRLSFYRGRLPMVVAFRVMDDLCLYTAAEIPDLMRRAKSGRYPAKSARPVARPYICIRDGIVCRWDNVVVRNGVVCPVG